MGVGNAGGAVDFGADACDFVFDGEVVFVEEAEFGFGFTGIHNGFGEFDGAFAAMFPMFGHRHARAGVFGGLADDGDFVVGVRMEMVDADDRGDVTFFDGFDVAEEVAEALFDEGGVGFGVDGIEGFSGHDAGAAVIEFGAGRIKPRLFWSTVITGAGTISVLVDLVGSAAAALTSPGLIASSGITLNTTDGTAIQNGERVFGDFEIGGQTKEYRYYGLIVTLGGTTPDIVEATSEGFVVMDAASNLLAARAAIPA